MIAPGEQAKKDFPILQQMIQDKPLIFLDNAATTQKPKKVIDAISDFYMTSYSNVHRSVHTLGEMATIQYEAVRTKIKHFIHAKDQKEIVFCRGATEAINMVAQSFVAPRLTKGDEIIISELEHHSNIVPWQLVCQKTGAKLKVIPIDDNGQLDLQKLEELFNKKTKFLSVSHISNSLGTINPVKKIIEMAHSHSVPVLVDGAQALSHQEINVSELNCAFYVFSGHKMYGPTGIGVLYGKTSYLESMSPYQGGGEMVINVTMDAAEYDAIPFKFEAGTPHIAGAIGLGAAIDYLSEIGMDALRSYKTQLTKYLLEHLRNINGITILGNSEDRASIVSFILEKIHAHDVGSVLNSLGIAIRSGHMCAMPVMNHYLIPAASRVSLGVYNTKEDIDQLIVALDQVKVALGR